MNELPLHERITLLYEQLQLSANKEIYDRVMVELLDKNREKSQLIEHVMCGRSSCKSLTS
jgi:hypothetical protein